MKFLLALLTALTLAGCADRSQPTAPDTPAYTSTIPATSASATVYAMVVDPSGICILGATIDVIAGQATGQSATQTEGCDAWWVPEIEFKDLTPGVEMTLRASAPGYLPQTKTIVPTLGPQTAVIFAPVKTR